MELKEFVKTAITDITEAVNELQGELNNGSVVCPSYPHAISNKTIKHDGMNRLISEIDFDVAVTVGNSGQSEGGGKLGIQILSASYGKNHEEHNEMSSRMNFTIPVIFPTCQVKDEDKQAFDESQTKRQEELRAMRQKIRDGFED